MSRAEIKAYEARRAAEGRPISAAAVETNEAAALTSSPRRTYVMTREEEYDIIRGDLKRLLLILAVLCVAMVVCTILLR